MAEETRKLIVTQPEETAFALSGSDRDPPMQHRVAGELNHRTDKPIVHMHLWQEDCVGKLEGNVVVRGNPDAPVVLQHDFPGEHRQSHVVKTGLADPIHHALQMRTPLQLRLCNSWHIASDYSIGIVMAGREWLGIRLTGATVATPQPCPEDRCPPHQGADHP